jgi:molybdopterin-guanine dinucleotide biosynthesis protein
LPRGTRVKYVDCTKKEQQITTTETDSMVLETASDWEIIWFPFNLFQMVAGVFPLG